MARENPPNFRPNCEKISRHVDYRDFSENSEKKWIIRGTLIEPILKTFKHQNKRIHSTPHILNINHDTL